MACQEELGDRPPGVDHPGAVGRDLHAFFHGEGAGGNEGGLALHLHDAHAAGAAWEQLFDVTEGGDLLPAACAASRIQVPGVGLYLSIVDCQIDHGVFLPSP